MRKEPKIWDVLYLLDDEGFVYIHQVLSKAEAPIFEVLDFFGEAYQVVSAPDKTAILAAAVHNEPGRQAWRVFVE